MENCAYLRKNPGYAPVKPKTGAGSGNFSCEWEREFVFLGGWDARLARETERYAGFQFQRDFIPAQKPQAGGNEPFVRIAVSGFKY